MTWKEFLQHNFDKILLLFLIHAIVTLMITTLSTNAGLTDWLKNEASTAMGALIMLITGRNSRPDPTISASTTTTNTLTLPPVAPVAPQEEKK